MAIRRDRFLLFNTLACVLKGLEGQYTTIDLRDEACLTGKIINVDGSMNMELEDVIFYDRRGLEHPFETFFVNSRLIRYVHIPADQSVVQVAQEQLQNLVIPRTKRLENFKTRRAKRYQKEIVESMNAVNVENESKDVDESAQD